MGVIQALNRGGAFLAGIGILAMMAVGTADVFGLFLFNHPLPGAYELTETLMVSTVFLAVAMAQAKRAHVRVEVFLHLLPRRAREGLELLGELLTAALFAAIAFTGWRVAAASVAIGEYSAGLIHFPIWPAKCALALGASMMVLQNLAEIAARLGMLKPERPPLGREGWTH